MGKSGQKLAGGLRGFFLAETVLGHREMEAMAKGFGEREGFVQSEMATSGAF